MAAKIGACPRTHNDDEIHMMTTNVDCNHNLHSRNNCMKNMKCTCKGIRFHRNQLFCGHQLIGDDCNHNVIYRCRRFGVPDPIENCPFGGCHNNRCGIEKTITIFHDNNHNDDNVTIEREQENEFVTFEPIIDGDYRILKFEP
ncbi:hypothetical protein HUG17_0995 [Dermatophagoides farinae]|uniref:Uncharacterized protein n=1 Tax=Dermatophagoides farinae TaxID=6954 RepID=A0A9D4SKU2_DERFA|nr:hypothetical protein HUG17_0995 [Dermatophagoides farinae]